MREIKFRAWDGEKFRESFVIHQANGLAMIETTTPLGTRYLETQHNWVVQQYTGLKDKNGVEIYEGDIVSMTSRQVEIKGVVEYQPPCFIVVKDVAEYNLYNYDSIEVVGNIFEGIDK